MGQCVVGMWTPMTKMYLASEWLLLSEQCDAGDVTALQGKTLSWI